MENNKCTGPCLQHCYKKNDIEYLIIGLIIGIFIGIFIGYLCYNKNDNDNDNI
jgi:uncharacterized membrane-anchored protein YhcB (DUF1043 family)